MTAETDDHAALIAAVSDALDRGGVTAIAVSGGSDSLALLHLADEAGQVAGRSVAAVTVDHGLRAESAAEAQGVRNLLVRHHDLFDDAEPPWNTPAAALGDLWPSPGLLLLLLLLL